VVRAKRQAVSRSGPGLCLAGTDGIPATPVFFDATATIAHPAYVRDAPPNNADQTNPNHRHATRRAAPTRLLSRSSPAAPGRAGSPRPFLSPSGKLLAAAGGTDRIRRTAARLVVAIKRPGPRPPLAAPCRDPVRTRRPPSRCQPPRGPFRRRRRRQLARARGGGETPAPKPRTAISDDHPLAAPRQSRAENYYIIVNNQILRLGSQWASPWPAGRRTRSIHSLRLAGPAARNRGLAADAPDGGSCRGARVVLSRARRGVGLSPRVLTSASLLIRRAEREPKNHARPANPRGRAAGSYPSAGFPRQSSRRVGIDPAAPPFCPLIVQRK
jgi:hypothetical protein